MGARNYATARGRDESRTLSGLEAVCDGVQAVDIAVFTRTMKLWNSAM